MKVINGIDRYPHDAEPVVATVGNFDGVHLGHLAILRTVVERSRESGASSLLVTFDPHPATVVAPERRPRLLQSRRQKLEALEAAGLDEVLILRFDEALASMTGEAFFDEVLCGPIRFAAIHVGHNFRFGRDRHGDKEVLDRIGARHGFDVVAVSPVETDGKTVSSSAIRRAVDEGDVGLAHRMLGRPFSVAGEVVRGDARGRALTFPTANLDVENEVVPARGVYVSEAVTLAARHAAVSNVGIRPTFGGTALTVEAHLLDFEGDLYGERVEVRFLAKIRDEMKFSGSEELADQIARDRAAAVSYFRQAQTATS